MVATDASEASETCPSDGCTTSSVRSTVCASADEGRSGCSLAIVSVGTASGLPALTADGLLCARNLDEVGRCEEEDPGLGDSDASKSGGGCRSGLEVLAAYAIASAP